MLKESQAWNNAKARAAMEEALQEIRENEEMDNRTEVNRLIEKLNEKLKKILEALPSGSNRLPEDAKLWCESLLDDAGHGYESAKDTVNIVLNSSKGETCPSKDQVKAALLRTLTKEQVAELQKLREPTLLIVPDTTAERLKGAVNKPACKTMQRQKDAYFDNFYTNALSAIATQNGVLEDQAKITKYRFVITEGKQHFDAQAKDHDYAWNKRENMKNEDRIAAFEKYLQAHPGLVSQNAAMYMMLMIRGLKGGNPADRISDTNWQFTLLPGEPKTEHVKGGLVGSGRWNSVTRQARFGSADLGAERDFGRLRAAVMGEIT